MYLNYVILLYIKKWDFIIPKRDKILLKLKELKPTYEKAFKNSYTLILRG